MTDLPERRSYDSAVARIEAKLDVAIAQHGAKLDEHTRQIQENTAHIGAVGQRISGIEIDLAVVAAKAGPDGVFDRELREADGRLRSVEQKVWVAVGGSAVLASLGSYLLPRLLGG